ncbi:MAG: ribosome rescue protein RqcH [Acidilobaceae archaeon]
MSNLDVHVWVRGASGLAGCRVDNLYAYIDGVLLKFRCPGRLEFTVLEPGLRVHRTSRVQGFEEGLRGFVRVLRRHVRDLRLEGVEQLGFDRVVRFTLGDYSLYVEVLPRGVAALVDSSGSIVASSSRVEMRDRVVKPGAPYKPPPLQAVNPFTESTIESLWERLRGGRDVVRGLVRGLGVPGEAAEEAVYRAGLSYSTSPESLAGGDVGRLLDALKSLYPESLEGRGYLVFSGEGLPVEATPFEPKRFPGGRVRVYSSFDEALDDLFSSRIPGRGVLDAEVARLERSLAEARELEAKYRSEAEHLRRVAELAASNYELLDSTINCVVKLWRAGDAGKCSNVSEVRVNEGYFTVSLGDYKVKVYYGESAQNVIVRLYREAGELEGKAERARIASEEALRKLGELEVKARARIIASRASLRKIAWFERFRWTITSNGLLAIGGRDASQNESIVRRYLRDEDVFMHADIQGGSTVILRTGNVKPSREDLEDAATLAACYSRAWKAGLGSVDVYWVYGSQVSKSAPPGEYLKTGAFMVYGARNYLRGVKLLLALGVALDTEENPIVIVGSERTVKPRSIAYVILAPGSENVREAGAKVKELLLKTVDDKGKPYVIALKQEVIEALIPGKSSIIRVSRGDGGLLDLRVYE